MSDPKQENPSVAPTGAAEGDAQAETSDLEQDLADAERRAEEYLNDLRRVAADFDNYRKRVARETEAQASRATESMVGELLPVLDNLERALGAARTAGGAEGVVGGIELIHRELLKVLERAGVTRYSALGQTFDPTRHEAIARVVSVDAKPGTVVGETMPGYLLHNRVLRAALVSVAAAPDEDN